MLPPFVRRQPPATCLWATRSRHTLVLLRIARFNRRRRLSECRASMNSGALHTQETPVLASRGAASEFTTSCSHDRNMPHRGFADHTAGADPSASHRRWVDMSRIPIGRQSELTDRPRNRRAVQVLRSADERRTRREPGASPLHQARSRIRSPLAAEQARRTAL